MRTEAEKVALAKSFLEARGFKVTKPYAVKPPTVRQNSMAYQGFMRQPEVLALVPFSSGTLWRKCKSGDFPKPVKLSERVTAWRASEILEWLSRAGHQ